MKIEVKICQIYVDGLIQERRNSIAKAMELHLSCTNPSIWLYGGLLLYMCESNGSLLAKIMTYHLLFTIPFPEKIRIIDNWPPRNNLQMCWQPHEPTGFSRLHLLQFYDYSSDKWQSIILIILQAESPLKSFNLLEVWSHQGHSPTKGKNKEVVISRDNHIKGQSHLC